MSKEDKKWSIGSPIPDRLFQTINLYSISEGISKSQVLRDSLAWWIQRENLDIENLKKEVAKYIQNEWLRKKSTAPIEDLGSRFKTFIEDWRHDLWQKKVNKKLIDEILEKVVQ